ncbi:Uncharacterised protein [Weeksella virosa]|uniref:Uncharacterized protein n=1 Tax=Weeksella virosa (strain ATCC 43766 / DSM 16922 / JCM 21250 / CCUG 30538 / CDC 9751 / IAM 14551 / NBRC 16016 / NCTC 11634 / CL345/78) TaxID=865938 RepID=F0NXT3_WEEVC|nr:hypothetical protein [Weeksella virosa]ADX66990.1 hypothetical protein Weevi_0268 [Weeksella virosa DSM 16922]VEH63281.1 Uncharacterised protein [Weeksella virosa]
MNNRIYREFHDKFTKENQFEFSQGIYLFRDYVRNRPVSICLLQEFTTLVRSTPGIERVLNYLLEKNKNSSVTVSAIKLIQENIT